MEKELDIFELWVYESNTLSDETMPVRNAESDRNSLGKRGKGSERQKTSRAHGYFFHAALGNGHAWTCSGKNNSTEYTRMSCLRHLYENRCYPHGSGRDHPFRESGGKHSQHHLRRSENRRRDDHAGARQGWGGSPGKTDACKHPSLCL
jgi:hypothetical protein